MSSLFNHVSNFEQFASSLLIPKRRNRPLQVLCYICSFEYFKMLLKSDSQQALEISESIVFETCCYGYSYWLLMQWGSKKLTSITLKLRDLSRRKPTWTISAEMPAITNVSSIIQTWLNHQSFHLEMDPLPFSRKAKQQQ